MGAGRMAAMAETLDALYGAVPYDGLAGVPVRPDHRAGLIARLHIWHGQEPRPAAGAAVRAALCEGTAWLDRSGPAAAPDVPGTPVFGLGDGNLANYIRDADASRIRVVDFEDSEHRRSPPGTAERQAGRMRELLG
ncbi:hypothetical protein ACFVYE_30920 [Streptomyces sp. NPDC058239]|uniref:hypothetical protein n=1 Tax=unclassified Streptomyces TaxID=2593676 RepID=UPI0036520162